MLKYTYTHFHEQQGRCGATNHLRRYWQKRFWIPIGVFFLGLLLLAATIKYTERANEERVQALAKLNALTYANQMMDQLQQAVAITESLEQIIISEDGRLDRFETIAKKQMNGYIHSIQLAPGGIVNQVYPSAGNDWAKLDLMTGGLSTKICQYGIDSGTVTCQGPTALPQGGQGIAVRNPVFLENDTGEKVFWGFTIALIRVPDIFRNTIDTLTNFGYYHRLSVATLPVSESYTPVNSSGVAFTESVSYTVELGNCCWKLEVAPIAGWNADSARNVVLAGGLVIVLLLTALVSSLLFLDQRRLQFRDLAVTDALTGLLNRQGFSQAMEDYFRRHGASPCVVGILDIDDFKLINDVYGHAAGDQVLKDIARNLLAAFPEDSIIGRNGGDEFTSRYCPGLQHLLGLCRCTPGQSGHGPFEQGRYGSLRSEAPGQAPGPGLPGGYAHRPADTVGLQPIGYHHQLSHRFLGLSGRPERKALLCQPFLGQGPRLQRLLGSDHAVRRHLCRTPGPGRTGFHDRAYPPLS